MNRLIYGLECPFTKEVHYIGKSTQGMSRPLTHLKKSHSEKVNEWVKALSFLGQKPNIVVIEKVSIDDDIDYREAYWIQKQLSKGVLLFNSNLVSVALVSSKLDKLVNGPTIGIDPISNFVKERRIRAGLNQITFAEKAGVALTVVRKIEQGRTNINVNSLITVLSMFGAKLDVCLK